MAGRKGLIPGIGRNIAISVRSSAEAIELWKANSKLDAWITYESWHYRLSDVTDLVQLPEEDKLYRGTPESLRVYQVWLLKDGKRTNAGTFKPDEAGTGSLTYKLSINDQFNQIGITKEPDSNGTKPRGDKIVGSS